MRCSAQWTRLQRAGVYYIGTRRRRLTSDLFQWKVAREGPHSRGPEVLPTWRHAPVLSFSPSPPWFVLRIHPAPTHYKTPYRFSLVAAISCREIRASYIRRAGSFFSSLFNSCLESCQLLFAIVYISIHLEFTKVILIESFGEMCDIHKVAYIFLHVNISHSNISRITKLHVLRWISDLFKRHKCDIRI